MSDLATSRSAFGDLLHRAGLPTTPERAGRFAQAVGLAEPATVDDLYWVARVTFVTGEEQLDTFDRVFGQVFRGTVDPADSRGDLNATPPAHVRRREGAPSPIGRERGAVLAHVRRVAHHEIEIADARQRIQYIALQEFHSPVQLQTRGVGVRGDFQRLRREIDPEDFPAFNSLARARAMHPEPVPTSTILGVATP